MCALCIISYVNVSVKRRAFGTSGKSETIFFFSQLLLGYVAFASGERLKLYGYAEVKSSDTYTLTKFTK